MLSSLFSKLGMSGSKKKQQSQVPETGISEDPVGFARYVHAKGQDRMKYKASAPEPLKQTPAQNVALRLAQNSRKKSRAMAAINQNKIPALTTAAIPMEKSTDSTATGQKALTVSQTPLPASPSYNVDV